MIIDVHTHLMWYPEHISEQFASALLEAKKVKLEQSGGAAHAPRLDLHVADSRPQDHWTACQTADRTVVFGLQAKATGVWVPNDDIAEYVSHHPDRLVGWASVDPNAPDALWELERCVHELNRRGLKVGPAYQQFDPMDKSVWPLFARAEKLDIPVIFHQGATFPTQGWLRPSNPMMLEPMLLAFPDLRVIVAHMAHPWHEDLIVLMRKTPNLYADISALHYRPFQYWRSLVAAMEYGVTHKLLLGSDFPSATLDQVIEGLRRVNDIVEGTRLPRISEDVMNSIINHNWSSALPELS